MTGVQTCALPICFPVTICCHIVGIEQPTGSVLIGAYNVLIKQIMEDARAAIVANV